MFIYYHVTERILTEKHSSRIDIQTHVGSSSARHKQASYYLAIKQHETVPTVQSVHHCHGQNTPKSLV